MSKCSSSSEGAAGQPESFPAKNTGKNCRQPQAAWIHLCAGEPFRLLFPVGILIGLAGVMMWPLYIWKITTVYPGQFHARVMIEGFLTSFVIGFLGTAFPRLLDVPRFTLWETLGFAGAVSVTAGLHATGRTLWGDQIFFFTLSWLVAVLAMRGFLFRKDVPPPGFVLVLLGLSCALFGSATQVVARVAPMALPEAVVLLGKLLLHQGYLVLPIMGIGAFLLPRFFGLPSRQNLVDSPTLPPGWLTRATFALFCGGLVLAGFVLEVWGDPHWGNGLRAAGIAVYFLREIPIHRGGLGGGTLAHCLRLALPAIPAAYVLMAVFPERAFSFLHVLFITGFSLLTFTVASRVILGHSGQSGKFGATLWPVRILASLVVLAMVTRVSADWMPDIRMNHYAYAAVAWIGGVLVWSAFILPGVRREGAE